MNCRRASFPVAVSLAVTAAFFLAGCSSGGSGSDKSAGTGPGDAKGSASRSDSKSSKARKVDQPNVDLPSDVRLTFEKAPESDLRKVAALSGAENFIRSIEHGIVKQDADDSAYKLYSEFRSPAQLYARDQIQQHVDAGSTVTGERRYTSPKVHVVNKKNAVVTFCSDGSKFYGKDVKTGKVTRTRKSVKDFYFWRIGMNTSGNAKGPWRAKRIEVQGEATQCM
ncbi:hypothetical protein AB0436_20230 [Streptomyces sp. NPDC051322]|uniref:hypothetical protein n=1 Tax=Streptomyces sp. NPDC051322 TaxID=3154645 RepID=UPI00344B8106